MPLKATTLYRVAAVLLLLFTIGHTLGFRQSDPHWGVDTMLASMRSIHFDVQGSNRTYWDLFLGAGFSVGVLYLFAALLAWQLGGLPPQTLRQLRPIGWTFALAFAALTVVAGSTCLSFPSSSRPSSPLALLRQHGRPQKTSRSNGINDACKIGQTSVFLNRRQEHSW